MIVRDIVSDIVRNVERDPWGKGQAIPEWMKLGWNLFQPDPLIGPEPVFSVASANYDESGNNIGNNPRIDPGKGLWVGPEVTNLASPKWSVSPPDGHTISVSSPVWQQLIAGSVVTSGVKHTFTAVFEPYGGSPAQYIRLTVNDGSLWAGAVSQRFSISGRTEVSITFTGFSTNVAYIKVGAQTETGASDATCYGGITVVSWQLTATAYPVPYVPPGATQLTNAATTGGNGTNIPLDAGLLKCLGNGVVPAVCTVMAEHYMGVGSGDLPQTVYTYISFLSASGDIDDLLTALGRSNGTQNIVRTRDGTGSVALTAEWSANEIHRRYVQTSSDGTKFRVGYQRYTSAMVEITSGIQWSHTGAESTWATFDGSFNPLSYLRLGLNLTVPIWGRKIVIANKSLSAAEISDAWGLVA